VNILYKTLSYRADLDISDKPCFLRFEALTAVTIKKKKKKKKKKKREKWVVVRDTTGGENKIYLRF
jgi:hypothetical protein